MFCPQCGAPNDDESIFCGNCGAVLDPDAEPIADRPPTEDRPAGESQPVETDEPEASSVEKMLDVTPDEPAVAEEPAGGYEAPTYGAQAAQARPAAGPPTSGMAIAALALGISGLTVFPFLGSILALIFGYMGRNEVRQRPDEISGEGLAVAGIVTGWIGVGLTVFGLVVAGGFMLCGVCGAFGASGGY
jgi:hypothetical protein